MQKGKQVPLSTFPDVFPIQDDSAPVIAFAPPPPLVPTSAASSPTSVMMDEFFAENSTATPPPFVEHVGTRRGNTLEDFRRVLLMYLVHALPYTQSAFNWLFYAFLNRNLRQSSRCQLGTRSGATSTAAAGADNGHFSVPAKRYEVPLWKNIQHVGSYLKSAGIDTGNTLFRRSPFRSRSRIRSRLVVHMCGDGAPAGMRISKKTKRMLIASFLLRQNLAFGTVWQQT